MTGATPSADRLLVAVEGGAARVIQIDQNASYAVTVDGNVITTLSTQLGFPVQGALLAYNHFTPATDPATGEHVLLIGFEAWVAPTTVSSVPASEPLYQTAIGAHMLARAHYLVRHADGSYDVHIAEDPSLTSPPARVSTRTLAVSPFTEDDHAVVYAGGYDCNTTPSHNSAWALRAPIATVLGR
jgi:hypothetical protein